MRPPREPGRFRVWRRTPDQHGASMNYAAAAAAIGQSYPAAGSVEFNRALRARSGSEVGELPFRQENVFGAGAII
jgi:hypothetical protein